MLKYIIISWILIQLGIFTILFYFYTHSILFKHISTSYYITFPLARTSASLINLSLSLCLISIIRLPLLFTFIPFKLKYLHFCFCISLSFWSFIHIISHYITFIKFKTFLFSHPIHITGIFLISLLIIISLLSLPYIRKTFYQSFLYSHYTFIFLFAITLIIHGNFCILKG